MEVYKIRNGFNKVDLYIFLFIAIINVTRNNRFKLKLPLIKTVIEKTFFFV